MHAEAANRGLTQILQEPSPFFFFLLFFYLFPSPKSKHLSSCLAFVCAAWEQTPQRNSRARTTTTTATASTQRSSKQRRRLDIPLFSSQETKWLPDAVWRQITRAWATEMTRLFSVKSFQDPSPLKDVSVCLITEYKTFSTMKRWQRDRQYKLSYHHSRGQNTDILV